MNSLWSALSFASTIIISLTNTKFFASYNPRIIFVFLYSIMILLLVKWSELNKNIRKDTAHNSEDFLPENFQMHAKSYQQITRTAKGPPVAELACFLMSLYFWYLDDEFVFFKDLTYLMVSILAVMIFLVLYMNANYI